MLDHNLRSVQEFVGVGFVDRVISLLPIALKIASTMQPVRWWGKRQSDFLVLLWVYLPVLTLCDYQARVSPVAKILMCREVWVEDWLS